MENTPTLDKTLKTGHFSLSFTYTIFLNMCEMNKKTLILYEESNNYIIFLCKLRSILVL